jgi:hypothetical protein
VIAALKHAKSILKSVQTKHAKNHVETASKLVGPVLMPVKNAAWLLKLKKNQVIKHSVLSAKRPVISASRHVEHV